jgi:predicted Zn-dependent protease
MSLRLSSIAVFGILIVAGVVVALGPMDRTVELASGVELWGDVLRDADQIGLQVVRVSVHDEMELGAQLTTALLADQAEDHEWTTYLTAVGEALRPHVRRHGMQYAFHVIRFDEVNAFAMPGGQVFVTRGLLGLMRSEAELAGVLAHEMSHVDLGHCIQRVQYRVALRRVGLGDVGGAADALRTVIATGYRQYEEVEADAQGLRMSAEAGYDPGALLDVIDRLRRLSPAPQARRPAAPAGELLGAIRGVLQTYGQSHPFPEERIRRLTNLLARTNSRLAAPSRYIGVENYRVRVPRSAREFPGEVRTF